MAVEYFRNNNVIGEIVRTIDDIQPNSVYVNFGHISRYEEAFYTLDSIEKRILNYTKTTPGELGIRSLHYTSNYIKKPLDDLNIIDILRTWHCWLLSEDGTRYYFDNNTKVFSNIKNIKELYEFAIDNPTYFYKTKEKFKGEIQEMLSRNNLYYKFTDIMSLIIYPDE